jgi:pimeloyl-ACP methyl ester carboxylesterase
MLYHEVHLHAADAEWLLFIHGAGGSTVTWKRQVPELQKKHNLLVVDLPGHGKMAGKSTGQSTYSFEGIAKKLWAVVDHHKIVRIHLVGVSLGTVIALTMREQLPQRVASLINGGAILRLSPGLKVLARTSLLMAKLIGYPAFYRLSAKVMMPRKNHQRSREVFIRESRVLSTAEFKKWTSMYFGLNKTLRRLFSARNHTPHLIVMGAQDHLFLTQAKRYAQLHDGVQLEVLKQCGHVVSIEQAAHFNRLVEGHLERFRIQE